MSYFKVSVARSIEVYTEIIIIICATIEDGNIKGKIHVIHF